MARRPPRRLFQAQYPRNPSRCHRTTVSGCIAMTLSRQLATNRENAIQNKRSVLFGRARFTVRFNITTCCRRARFSRVNSRCHFSDEKSDATIARISANIMLLIVNPAGKNVNYINAIEFVGATASSIVISPLIIFRLRSISLAVMCCPSSAWFATALRNARSGSNRMWRYKSAMDGLSLIFLTNEYLCNL